VKGENMRRPILFGIILAFVLGVGISIQKLSAAEENISIALIAKGIKYKYWNAVREGAEKAARDYGVQITFEGTEEEEQIQQQIILLQQALDKNPQAIVLSSVDISAITPYLEMAQAKGIPIIGFDSGVNSPIVRTTVATDNYGAGVLAADKMAELLGAEGKVGVVVQDITSKSATDRRDGFIDTINQNYPNMTVADVRYGSGDYIQSEEVTKEMFAVHPDMRGVFGTNEGSSIGIINAIKEFNKVDQVVGIGFDSGEEIQQAIREGIISGAITQNPRAVGYEAVEAAIRAYRGEILPEFIDTGFEWYDRSNIDNPEIQELLYE
jgi:ribose transport system substrate-binding protein